MTEPDLTRRAGKRGDDEEPRNVVTPNTSGKNWPFDVRKLEYSKEPAYFLNMTDDWDLERFPAVWTIGNAEILKCKLLALFCSRKFPGMVLRKSHDFAADLRKNGTPIIGGFQTPVEKMCLEIFLKGEQPIVICPARGIQNMRVEREWAVPIEEGRLLLVSPFGARQRRPTKSTAETRNKFVAAASDRLFILHAAANSRTLAFADEILAEEREVLTFDIKENENLKKLGATAWHAN
ncbi:MAG: DNA-protecting protein DprA [Bacteroidetes bacterium]|nr:DNA-protecting protein DprA [Bacteroidota bacterium]